MSGSPRSNSARGVSTTTTGARRRWRHAAPRTRRYLRGRRPTGLLRVLP
jgi:hypothetical protein